MTQRKIPISGFALSLLSLLAASPSWSAEKKNPHTQDQPQKVEAERTPANEAGDFVCVKLRNAKLAEMKAKLVEDCNVTKPFSLAATSYAVESTYTYCCHTK